jgi:nucleotide-binding universal stress UspA family protein
MECHKRRTYGVRNEHVRLVRKEDTGGNMIKRILVATDFSESSSAAVRYALDLSATGDGEVIVLHVVEGNPDCIHTVGASPRFFTDYIDPEGDMAARPTPRWIVRRDLCEEASGKLATLYGPGYQNHVRTVVTVGKPATEIVRVAREQGADLIMLGSRQHRGLRRFWRRGVARKVMRKAAIPVIVVDIDDRIMQEDVGPTDIPYFPIERDHADVWEEEWALTAKEMGHKHHHADVSDAAVAPGRRTPAA